MKFLGNLCVASLLAGTWIFADSPRQVRFLALGELPPFQQEIRDNVRYELEPPPGSIPPREVMLGYGGENSEPTPLRLGQLSAPLKAPPGAGPLVLALRDAAKGDEPWLRLDRPESGDFLVLLWRDPTQATWQKARSLVLPDDAVSGSVRYINISPAAVGITIGGEKLLLESGKMFARKVAVGAEQPFEIYLPDTTGVPKRLHAGVVLQNPGERTLVLIYLADGLNRRRPLKVTVLREQAPVPPPKK